MSEIIKFTEQELQTIADLQSSYQQSIFALGQIDLEKADLDQQIKNNSEKRVQLLDNWKQLQIKENELMNSLSQKYGDGILNIRDGTFKPNPKQ